MNNRPTDYAKFRIRLGAYFLDGLILTPLTISTALICRFVPALVLASLITVKSVVHFLYRPVCHKLWGKTLGKRVCRLEVTTESGESLSWEKALVRELLVVPGYIFGLVAIWFVMGTAPEISSYSDFKTTMRSFYEQTAKPYTAIYYMYAVLMPLLQVGFVLKHSQHRALHDLLAGTVVLHRPWIREDGTPAPVRCFLCRTTIPSEMDRCPACGWTFRE